MIWPGALSGLFFCGVRSKDNLPGGAPLGNKNATKNRPIAEVLQRVLLANDSEKLRKFAESLVDRAIAKDTAAAKEILDRIDGKVLQAIEHSGPDGGPIDQSLTVKFGHGGG